MEPQLEPTDAWRVDRGECSYPECDSEADYEVEVERSVTTLMCDSCSRENRIWVKENGLLDGGE